MKQHLFFGETIEGYQVLVINEREARAAAGILFAFGLASFFNAYLLHDFRLTQIFVTIFMVDFIIRVLINPRYAPSLILGRLFVSNQTPEYVGATQKRFAWSIGLVLAIPMFFMIVIFEYMTPIKIAVCVLCLSLLFFEASFGICLGCKTYQFITKNQSQYCPGGSCEVRIREEVQKISKIQWAILLSTVVLLTFVTLTQFQSNSSTSQHSMKCQAGKCQSGKCGKGM